jgi:putative oxidoreductase
LQKWQHCVAWAESHRELWLDCVRIYLGLGLFARGLLLVTNAPPRFFVDLLQGANEPWLLTGTLLHYIIFAHLIGGLLLTIGLLTRFAAIVQIPVLAGAVFIVHRQDGLFALGQSLELSALVLFLLVIFAISGAGRLSVDQVVFRAPGEPGREASPQI